MRQGASKEQTWLSPSDLLRNDQSSAPAKRCHQISIFNIIAQLQISCILGCFKQMNGEATNQTHAETAFDQNGFHRRDDIQRFYDNLSKWLDSSSATSEQPIRNKGLDVLDPQPGRKYLEIGSGQGDALIRIAKAVGKEGHVVGIDLSLGMNALARQRLDDVELLGGTLSSRVQLLTGDAVELLSNQVSKSFDGIFMSFTLELLEHTEMLLLLKECHRILKPEGRLVVVAMAKREPDSPAWAESVYNWLSKRFPPQLDCKPIWLWRLADDTEFRVKKLVLESIHGLPVDILLAMPK